MGFPPCQSSNGKEKVVDTINEIHKYRYRIVAFLSFQMAFIKLFLSTLDNKILINRSK